MKISTLIFVLCIFSLGITLGVYYGPNGQSLIPEVSAADDPRDKPRISPTAASDRDFYAPNSEDLAPDEMRLIACGTGMPTARPKQAASCWLLGS